MDKWILENRKVKVEIEKGLITSFVIRDKNINILNGEVGYVAIEDGLRNKIFGKDFKIKEVKANKNKITFKKTYPEADFIIKEEIKVTSEEVKWNVKVSLKKRGSRTINIYFIFPCLKNDSHLFVSHSESPLSPEKFTRKMYIYGGDMFRGELGDSVLLPLITVYHPEKNYGISISQPVDLPKPQLQYFLLKNKLLWTPYFI